MIPSARLLTGAVRRRRSSVLAVLVAASLTFIPVVVEAGPATTGDRAAAGSARSDFSDHGPGLLGHEGRWLTDAKGRAVLLHGVNLVAKGSETPAERGFGEDDAQWLQDHGFDVVRLGLSPDALMPAPGQIDQTYVASFASTVQLLTDHGLSVLVDLHQDGWGPTTSGNGFPDWMTNTHGAENTHTPFPLYYVTNPAIQAAFDSFWANENGPDGVGLQDQVASMFAALADAVGSNSNVLGYDLLNEPWPGQDWGPCASATGCPARDASGLDRFHRKVTAAIRGQDADHLVFGEPYVLFNFGTSPTHIALPGGDPRSGMSWHMYTTDQAHEPKVVQQAVAWSERTGGALLNTEFGAVQDPAVADRMTGLMDNGLVPWMWWSYDEMVHDMTASLDDGQMNVALAEALIRPHPVQVAGTPAALDFDPDARVLRFRYRTEAPSGSVLPAGTETVVKVPAQDYPGGYSARVTGGTITSGPGAPTLTIVADRGASAVFLKVWPKGETEPSDAFPPSPLDPDVAPTDPTATTSTTSTTSTTASPRPDAAGAAPVTGHPGYTG